MENEQGHHDPGRHLLGPHVIGQRVVIRRLVRGETGPTGGPAFTDLLGECLAWGDGVAVVRPASGPAVEIAIADIVSGKPVPPRPSVRHRVSVADAEAHTARLWGGIEATALGEWVLRTEPAPRGRPRKRANSCLAVGDPGLPLPDAAARAAAFYAERDRPALLHVEAASDEEAALTELGWAPLGHGDADLRLASVSRVRRTLRRPSRPVEVTASGPFATATAGDGCDPTAEGRAALDGDWLGLHGVTVDPAYRRRGLATDVIAALLEWGAEQGATTAWLHVETDNPGGGALWESLGFTTHHTMRYLTRPGS
ncbi:GNAT family N-acetyltransferase [Nocardioides sp. GY 10113]|uniref:GNAT family N-acetyltransferase n=1 Tax=Nocardioides sp. GY 10113 TaxID=2569761 RepID=UPI0010A85AAD|nr:GNAT family N-acetyltransferase [Nocardioides sp. GY 10113]TIC87361.1 GNAT family N-acetyltransferase [Nocardioides sp. GY 10113]